MSQFDDLKSRILYEIWLHAQKPGDETTFTIDALENKILSSNCLSGMTRAAITSLKEEGYLGHSNETYVEYGGREYNQDEYHISEAGIRATEYDATHPGNVVYEIANTGDRHGPAEAGPLGAPTVPAADRVVTLQHNSDPYKDAIEALDAAVAEFRKDHHFENDWGPEKTILLQSLEAGQNLLLQTQVQVATAYGTLVVSLQVIREKYDHAIVAGLITAAVDRVVPAVERAIGLLLTLLGLS
jgi:hypothetical protein